MTIDKVEAHQIAEVAIREYKEREQRALRDRMSKLGRSRSPKKRKASLENIKKAQAARRGRMLKKVKK